MLINRDYTPRRRRRRGLFSRYWPFFVVIALGIIFYETRPEWLFPNAQNALPTPTRSAISYFEAAQQAANAGNYDLAIAGYQQLATIEPENPAPLIELSRIYLMLYGQYDTSKAYEYGRKAVEVAPNNPEAQNTLARVLDWQMQLEDAADLALQSLDAEPENPTTLAVLAEIYNDAGNPDRAQGFLDQALQIDPNHPLALRNQAQLYDRYNEYEKVLQTLDQAIAVAPNRIDLYFDKARTQWQGFDDFASSVETLRTATNIYPSVVTSTTLGEALNRANDPFAAVSVLRSAIQADPNFGPAQIQLGMALFTRRNYEDAVTALLKGVELMGEDKVRSEQMLVLGQAYIYQEPQDCDSAAKWLKKLIDRDLAKTGELNGFAIQSLRACRMEYLGDGSISKQE